MAAVTTGSTTSINVESDWWKTLFDEVYLVTALGQYIIGADEFFSPVAPL